MKYSMLVILILVSNLVSAMDCEKGQSVITVKHVVKEQSYTITGSFNTSLLGDATSMKDVLGNGIATAKIKNQCEILLGTDVVLGWSEGVFTTVNSTTTKWFFTSTHTLSCAEITATCRKK